ncbi:MAG: hypothetical protein AAB434_07440 [Planctomycetota bacterium]
MADIDVSARVEKLEKSLRLWRLGFLGIVFLFLGVFAALSSVMGELDEVSARRIVVKDGEDVTRATISADDDGQVRISLLDAQGRPRLVLGAPKDGAASLALRDEKGYERILVGTGDGYGVTLSDTGGADRVALGISVVGGPVMAVCDVEGKPRGALSLSDGGDASLILYSDQSIPQMMLVGNPEGSSVTLANNDGVSRLVMGCSVKTPPNVTLLGQDQKPIWSATK